MKPTLISSLVGLVKEEEQRRESARSSMTVDAALESVILRDGPLTNGLYIFVLLLMWHEIEKELVLFAARSAWKDESPITHDDFKDEVVRLGALRASERKKELKKLLPALDTRAWDLLDVLRLLANSLKHNPFDKPTGTLLKRLGFPENTNCASLSESGLLQFGLGRFLGIGETATFSEIVDEVSKSCNRILFLLQTGRLRPFDMSERVSLDPETFER